MNPRTSGNPASRTEMIEVAGLRYNVRHWGDDEAPRIFLLHGWMDSSATFQFVVDALRQSWHVIAPDWRGYGQSQWLSRPYWFPDYYADLDGLLKHYSPDEPARIVGHSMGANIASTYAAIKPERVSRLVMVDFLGLKPPADIDAPTQISHWLKGIQDPPRMRAYPAHADLARQLRRANHRLSAARALFLAQSVSRVRPDGAIEMACDPWHKIPAPTIYRVDEAMACWRKITAPVLMLIAEHGYIQQRFGNDLAEYERRINSFQHVEVKTIKDAGHNIQHDQPEELAAAVEAFLATD